MNSRCPILNKEEMVQNEMLQNTPASGLHVEAEAAIQETAAQRTALSSRNGSCSGSIYRVGWRFQSFKINDLEMVDQNSGSWNRVADWLRQVDQLQHAA